MSLKEPWYCVAVIRAIYVSILLLTGMSLKVAKGATQAAEGMMFQSFF